VLFRSDGHVAYALVDRAPYEGGTPSVVAVPWLAFQWDWAERTVGLPGTKGHLNDAKVFDSKDLAVFNDRRWVDETYSYYSVEPGLYERGWGMSPENQPAGSGGDNPNNPDGTNSPNWGHPANGSKPTDTGNPSSTPAKPGNPDHSQGNPPDTGRSNTNPPGPDNTNGMNNPSGMNNQGTNSTGVSQPGAPRYIFARKVKGQTLRGAEDKVIGDVDELVFDAHSGRMAFIVAQFGGFLGIGDSAVAVPWDYFKVNEDGHLYTNTVTADQVRTAPRIERADWSELRDPQFLPGVYKHFGRDYTWYTTGFQRNGSRAMGSDQSGDYQAMYARGPEVDVNGTVERISRDESVSGAGKMQVVTIRTDNGDRLVHLAPASYLQDKGCNLKEGDRVTIKGHTAMVDGKQVVIASSIKTQNGTTVELRNQQGNPQWANVDENR